MSNNVEVPEWDQPEGVLSVPVKTTGYYAIQLPSNGIDAETTLLCVLHGWGQNGRSFLRRFACLKQENIIVVAPQAPHQFYLDLESRKVGFSWITVYDRNRAMDDIYRLIDDVMEAVRSQYNVHHPPVMLGFSQGCSIAYRYHLHGERPVRAIVSCGGDLPKDVRGPLAKGAPIEVLLVHGKEDGIVPLSKGEEAERILRDSGCEPTIYHFEGGHELPEAVVLYIGEWVRDRSTDAR